MTEGEPRDSREVRPKQRRPTELEQDERDDAAKRERSIERDAGR
jgi:hypothetical protein